MISIVIFPYSGFGLTSAIEWMEFTTASNNGSKPWLRGSGVFRSRPGK